MYRNYSVARTVYRNYSVEVRDVRVIDVEDISRTDATS